MYLSYTYYLFHRHTNRFYYGSRCKNIEEKRTPEEDLWIHYFTSSKNVKTLVEEYGEDSFEITIILQSENYKDCYWYEQRLIKENIKNPDCINKTYVDYLTGKKIFSMANRKHSDKTRKKQSESQMGESNGMYGKTPWNKDKPESQIAWNRGLPSEQQPWYEKSHSLESKELMKNIWEKRIADGYVSHWKGRKREPWSDERKIEKSRAMMGKSRGAVLPLTDEHKKNISIGLTGKTKGIKRGPYSAERNANISAGKKGKHWWNNGDQECLTEFCPENWFPGRIKYIK